MGVSLKKVSGAAEEVNYPWKETEQARTRDEYLRKEGRSNVTWIGDAAGYGFDVDPTPETAMLLFNGMAAHGERLLPKAVVQGIDMTFSMSKDISVLHAIGPPAVRRRIERARTRAIERTLEFVEREFVRVRRGSGKNEAAREVLAATGLVGIRYEHSYSRLLDPQLHDHVMLSTVVRNPDGELRRWWIESMRDLKRTAGYFHEAVLREEISSELPGVQWERVQENGTAQMAQIPESLRGAMSSRRAHIKSEIQAWEAARGRTASAAVKQMITLYTRPPKPDVPDHKKWTATQVAVAAQHGVDQAAIELGILHAPAAVPQQVPPAKELTRRLLGEKGLTAEAVTFKRSDVIVAVIQAGIGASQIDEYVEQVLASRQVVEIRTPKRVRYTTSELVQAERQIERMVLDGVRKAPELAVNVEHVAHAIEELRFKLTEDQTRMVLEVATGPDLVTLVEAGAGTGKTTAASAIARAAEAQGIGVRGAAPTGKAAVELGDGAGIDSRTIDSLLLEMKNGGSLSDNGRYRIVIVDEAGMAHTRQMARLLGHARQERVKVIAIGDSNQLSSVAPGGWLSYFSRSGKRPAIRLTEIVRQRDPQLRKVLNELANGKPDTWTKYQTKYGLIQNFAAGQEHAANPTAARTLVEAADRRGWDQVLAITPRNTRKDIINELVQQIRIERGELGELLAANKGHEQIHVGDRVLLGRNNRRLGVRNGLLANVAGATDRGQLIVALDQEGTKLRFLPPAYVTEHVSLGYAVTDYKAQGATVEETVMIGAPLEFDLNRGYVAASRARDRTHLILESGMSQDRALEILLRGLQARSDDELAIEEIARSHRAANTDEQLEVVQARELVHEAVPLEAWETEYDRVPITGERLEELREEVAGRREVGDITMHEQADQLRARLEQPHEADKAIGGGTPEAPHITTLARQHRDTITRYQGVRTEEAFAAHRDSRQQYIQAILAVEPTWLREQLGARPADTKLSSEWERLVGTLADLRLRRESTDELDPGLRAGNGIEKQAIRNYRYNAGLEIPPRGWGLEGGIDFN